MESRRFVVLCVMCNKAFGQKSNLMSHKRIHSRERPFTCDVCNKAFSQQWDLLRHKWIQNGW
jgi:KRAB domain-containing zinc finger protein